jgi:chemotaxis protein CheD
MEELMVRMGELATSAAPESVLVSIGLGSCIGLALIDRRTGVAGLAHIMLPTDTGPADERPGKFADTAVPALVERLCALGAQRGRLDAVLVGGAQMLGAAGHRLDVGARNEAATRAALRRAGVRVAAASTGGTRGRTVRVRVGAGEVTVKEAGGKELALWPLPCGDRGGAMRRAAGTHRPVGPTQREMTGPAGSPPARGGGAGA